MVNQLITTPELGITPNWQSLNSSQELSIEKQELHLWWLPLTINSEQENTAYQLLNQKQLDKYHKRSCPNRQHAYLAGRYYLLQLLAAYSNCKPSEIELNYSRLNKPSLNISQTKSSDDNIHFNFTDTNIDEQHYGLFAFCRQHHVGVDVESSSRDSQFERIAQRRFTANELNYASEPNKLLNRQRCLAIWTRKEAYGKAIGKGINFQMNERNLVDANFKKNPFEYNFNDGTEDWRLLQIQPDSRFIASVVHQTHQRLSIKSFNCPDAIA